MLNLATIAPELHFLHDLFGDRNKQYRDAFWLSSRFEDSVWECCFDNHHTKIIDFNIHFPDGSSLTAPHHAMLLDTIKCFLCVQTHVDATGGRKLNVNTAYARLGIAIKLMDYLLLNADYYQIHKKGLDSLTSGDLTTMLLDIGSYHQAHQGIYRWSERLSQFLQTQISLMDHIVLDGILSSSPALQSNEVPHSEWTIMLTQTELTKARVWLYLHGFYDQTQVNGSYKYLPNHKKLAALIYANTLGGKSTNLPHFAELGYQLSTYSRQEYPSISVTNQDNEALIENTFLAYFHSLQYFTLLSNIGRPISIQALKAIKQKNIMEHLNLIPLGRFRTLPSTVVFSSLRKALEFASTYGDGLVDSYLSLVTAAHREGKTLRQWQQQSIDISPYLTPLIRNMGVKRWFVHEFGEKVLKSCHNLIYYPQLRANEGLWDLLRVLYGAVQMVVGTLMARRYGELVSLVPTKCLDNDKRNLIFFACKSGYDGKREKIARPIPSIVSKLIVLLERLQTGLHEGGLIDKYYPLFSYPKPHGRGLIKLGTMSFNGSLNIFCDYIETPVNRDGQRYYIRQHQLRRFFAMLFFWGSSFGGMDTLRWFLAHTDVEHLYHYITESMTGEVLRGVQSHYVVERLQAYDHDVDALANLLEHRFGTRKFDLLNTDELDAYVEDLIKEGQVSVEPEFFKDGEGKDYRILIKIRDKKMLNNQQDQKCQTW